MSGAKAEPVPTPDTQYYWDAARRGELAIQRCTACERHFFYPRDHCPHCFSDAVEWTTASGRGRLHTYVISHVPVPGFEAEVPYVIAIVELDEGPRMMSNLLGVAADPDLLELDMALEVQFVSQGDSVIPQFRPPLPA